MKLQPRARQRRFGTAAVVAKTGIVATARAAAETLMSVRAAAVIALVATGALAATAVAPALPVARRQVEGPERRTVTRTFVLRVGGCREDLHESGGGDRQAESPRRRDRARRASASSADGEAHAGH